MWLKRKEIEIIKIEEKLNMTFIRFKGYNYYCFDNLHILDLLMS